MMYPEYTQRLNTSCKHEKGTTALAKLDLKMAGVEVDGTSVLCDGPHKVPCTTARKAPRMVRIRSFG